MLLMMNDVVLHKEYHPDAPEEIVDFILVGREAIRAYKAKLKSIDRISTAKHIKEQTLRDAQRVGEAVLLAEAKLGEILKEMKLIGGNRMTQEQCQNKMTLLDIGLTRNDSHHAQLISENKDVVDYVINKSQDSHSIPTRAEALKIIREKQRQEEIKKYENMNIEPSEVPN